LITHISPLRCEGVSAAQTCLAQSPKITKSLFPMHPHAAIHG
jgi:hypothetical protein